MMPLQEERDNMIKRLSYLGIFTATALILGLLESMITLPISVPGIKLGLSNSVILYILMLFGFKSAFFIMIAKVTLSSLLFAGFNGFFYSLSGGLLSLAVMFILSRFKCFSTVGISIGGAATHNTAQLIVAAILTQSPYIIYYDIVLLPVAAVTGAITGVIVDILIKRSKEALK